jgi:hypothetical protein
MKLGALPFRASGASSNYFFYQRLFAHGSTSEKLARSRQGGACVTTQGTLPRHICGTAWRWTERGDQRGADGGPSECMRAAEISSRDAETANLILEGIRSVTFAAATRGAKTSPLVHWRRTAGNRPFRVSVRPDPRSQPGRLWSVEGSLDACSKKARKSDPQRSWITWSA